MASQLHASVLPFAITLMLAASASFATPIGYQTNLMVLGPGGYRFNDFLRIGLPITLITASVALLPRPSASGRSIPDRNPEAIVETPPEPNLAELREHAVRIAREAGSAILEIYGQDGDGPMDVTLKDDASPLTRADLASHRLITDALRALTPTMPILSEEAASDAPYPVRRSWTRFWLVDPLDGTKEFIKRNGEFTVNIALIEDGRTRPRGGARTRPRPPLRRDPRHARPAAARAAAAFQPIQAATTPHERPSASSPAAPTRDAETAALPRRPARTADRSRSSRRGSALKICQVADGTADLYPRLGPTMEWDTAAAHAVAAQAGAHVVDVGGAPLTYNKPDLHNPHFLVSARRPARPTSQLLSPP